MESWSYVSGGKGAMANDSIAPADSSSVSNNSLMGWELHTPCSFGSNLLVSNREDIGDQSFKKFGIQELVEKRVPNNSVNDVLCSKNHAIYPFMSNSSISFGGDESTSKISISAIESNGCWTSSLIDLNLGRFADHRDAHSSKFSHATTRLSSSASSTPPRRLRLGGVSSLTACCQVYGCNKDLSSSKDYHKRHRVCETHSKATKVIVNGVEQRFCQQCSRFHSLNEFDDSKRSCRKHLKGHNERRRKPQIDILSGRTAKLLRSHAAFAGCKYQGTKLPMSSSICQDVFGMGIFRPEKCVANDCCKRLKLEDRTDCNPLSATLSANRNLHSRSISTHYDFRKAAPSFHGTEGNTATESIFSVTRATHPHDLGGPNSCSSPLFQGSSLASDDFNGFYTDSAAQGSPAMSESGRALSLLSSKSHESSSPLSGIPVARPLVITGSNTTHYNINQVCEKLIGVSSQASNKSSSTGNYNPIGGNNLGSILMSQSSCNAANFDDSHGFYQGLDFMNSKDHLSCENGATIDLLHLSSQLQRVEHQRQSMQVKDDSDSFCCLRIT